MSISSVPERADLDKSVLSPVAGEYGLLISIAMHILALALLLFLNIGFSSHVLSPAAPAIVVNLVEEEKAAPKAGGASSPVPVASPHPSKSASAPQIQLSSEVLLANVLAAHHPAETNGAGNQAKGDAGGGAGQGRFGTLKDFVRAQVERRWQVDTGASVNPAWSVILHLVMNADGTLAAVKIMKSANADDSPAYQGVAQSARNAAWLSSPLQLPANLKNQLQEFDIELTIADAGK